MTRHLLLTVIFPLIFCVMALFFLAIGLRGIISRKPFLISLRWSFLLILLGFTPSLLLAIPFSGFGGGGSLWMIQWISPAILLVGSIFLYFALKGYVAMGVTDVSFREGLLTSLAKLNLPYEETLGSIKLPTIGADLQAAVQSWIGTAQLRMKQRQFNPVLKDVVNGMNEVLSKRRSLDHEFHLLHILCRDRTIDGGLRRRLLHRFRQNLLR